MPLVAAHRTLKAQPTPEQSGGVDGPSTASRIRRKRRGRVTAGVDLDFGLVLGQAKTKIRRALCSVGAIRRADSRRVGRVIRQSPRAGAIKRRGYPVMLTVGWR
jgi:hypothetical protein